MAQYWSVEECGWVDSPPRAAVAEVPQQSAAPPQEGLAPPGADSQSAGQTTMRMT